MKEREVAAIKTAIEAYSNLTPGMSVSSSKANGYAGDNEEDEYDYEVDDLK